MSTDQELPLPYLEKDGAAKAFASVVALAGLAVSLWQLGSFEARQSKPLVTIPPQLEIQPVTEVPSVVVQQPPPPANGLQPRIASAASTTSTEFRIYKNQIFKFQLTLPVGVYVYKEDQNWLKVYDPGTKEVWGTIEVLPALAGDTLPSIKQQLLAGNVSGIAEIKIGEQQFLQYSSIRASTGYVTVANPNIYYFVDNQNGHFVSRFKPIP